MNLIKRIFTWWHGQTMNTQFYTWRKGVRVGDDDEGNVYYQTRDGKRRWVIYNGYVEASRISANWHGWLHHTFKQPPSKDPLAHKGWEKPHRENLTGTDAAYAPSGSMRAHQPADRSDYDAWLPE